MHVSGTLSLLGCRDLVLRNSLAYACGNVGYEPASAAFYVIDLSEPEEPRVLGSTSIPNSNDVDVRGDLAFVAADGHGFQVVDISNSSQPKLVSTMVLPIPHFRSFVVEALNDTLVLVGGINDGAGSNKIFFVSVHDPGHPFVARSLDISGAVGSVAVTGSAAYVVTSLRLFVVDLRDLEEPAIKGSIPLAEYSSRSAINEGYLYVLSSSSISIIDVSTPFSPSLVDQFPYSNHLSVIAVEDHQAVIGHSGVGDSNMLSLFDVSNPVHFQLTSRLTIGRTIYALARIGEYLCLGTGTGITLIHSSNPAVVQGTSLPEFSGMLDMDVRGNLVYVANWTDGLRILDVSDPHHPSVVSSTSIGSRAVRISTEGSLAAVIAKDASSQLRRLCMIDVTEPDHPGILGSLDLPIPWGYNDYYIGGPVDLVLAAPYVYVAAAAGGLEIVDISDPSTPRLVAQFPTEWDAIGLAMKGDLIFLLTYDPGGLNIRSDGASLVVLRLEKPDHPVFVSRLNIAAASITIDGDLAILGQSPGLSVLDISDVENPRVITSTRSFTSRSAPIVVGTTVYTVDEYRLQVFSIADLPALRYIGQAEIENFPGEMVLANGNLLVAEGGLYVYPTQCGASIRAIPIPEMRLLRPFPNPARGTSNLRFSLTAPASVSFTVHDSRGALVRTIAPADYGPGEHTLRWDGRMDNGSDASSGVYFLTVAGPDVNRTARIVMVR